MEDFNRAENTIVLFLQAAEYTVAGLDEKNVIMEENGGMRAYPLFPFDPIRNVEVFYIEFDAGVLHESLPHVEGVEEYVFLVHGTLKMILGEKEVTLQEKQSLRFRADISHVYHINSHIKFNKIKYSINNIKSRVNLK